jgi:hypothetical protein
MHNRASARCRVQQKSSRETARGKTFLQENNRAELGCRRRRHVDVGIRLRFGFRLRRGRWRFLYDRRVAFLFFARWIGDGRFFLFARR